MAELKGSKTEQNLQTAFAGESQAHTKYLYYSFKAIKEGYIQIGRLFEETAKMRKNTLRYGSNSFMAAKFLIRQPILQMPQTERTMSGQTCMRVSQRQPKRKASRT